MTQQIPYKVGNYEILSSLGKGGMGEVFLAFDRVCRRKVALKRVRPNLMRHRVIKQRFLREAQITAHLSHPGIIPIHALHENDDTLYYVMPYVEGVTLKKRLLDLKKGQPNHGDSSVQAFVSLFLKVCQAIAYAHNEGYLHRDIKPENIMLGRYGQVFILDWGLVETLEHTEQIDIEEIVKNHQWTNPQRPVGTLAYMAPERALGCPATIQSDIYALGVILYQLLTLKLPFRRLSLANFRQHMSKEVLPDPLQVAPYRDIAPELITILHRCLAFSIQERYLTVDQLIDDIEHYLHGRSSWYPLISLDVKNSSDWQFQEAILLPQDMAIARRWQHTEWVQLMLSQAKFYGNMRLRVRCKIGATGKGIGLLLGSLDEHMTAFPIEGYSLWIGAKGSVVPTHLLRSSSQLMESSECHLEKGVCHEICFDRLEEQISVLLDGEHKLTYTSHIPLCGTHVGIMTRDADVQILSIEVFSGSLQAKISCLSIADAFFAGHDYEKALLEYRRIAMTFKGRSEGRQAIFRSGLTLLEKTIQIPKGQQNEALASVMGEFELLRTTVDAPLEYLGKAIVYARLGLAEEEGKCFALALRRYAHHPGLAALYEQMLYRLQIYSKSDRLNACRLACLLLQQGVDGIWRQHFSLFQLFLQSLETPFFVDAKEIDFNDPHSVWAHLMIHLAFWLAQPHVLQEIIPHLHQDILIETVAVALILLGATHAAIECIRFLSNPERIEGFFRDEISALEHLESFSRPMKACILQLSLEKERYTHIVEKYDPQEKLFDAFFIWAALCQGEYDLAEKMFQRYDPKELAQEEGPLYFLYGCWRSAKQGVQLGRGHFGTILHSAYPRSWSVAAHKLFDASFDYHEWHEKAFYWEKKMLLNQVALFERCSSLGSA